MAPDYFRNQMNNHHHSAQQIVYITVRLTMIGNCNPDEIVENLDYCFDDPAVVDSEIVGFQDI